MARKKTAKPTPADVPADNEEIVQASSEVVARVYASAQSSVPLVLEYRDPAGLAPNPSNWRLHPENQRRAVEGSIDANGWSQSLLYNRRTKRLIDGHLRRRIALDRGLARVPVLVGEWTDEQERILLATLDPTAELAESDHEAFRDLTSSLRSNQAGLDELLDKLRGESAKAEVVTVAPAMGTGLGPEPPDPPASRVPEGQFGVIVICRGEDHQRETYETLVANGHNCRVVCV